MGTIWRSQHHSLRSRTKTDPRVSEIRQNRSINMFPHVNFFFVLRYSRLNMLVTRNREVQLFIPDILYTDERTQKRELEPNTSDWSDVWYILCLLPFFSWPWSFSLWFYVPLSSTSFILFHPFGPCFPLEMWPCFHPTPCPPAFLLDSGPEGADDWCFHSL